MSVKIRYEIKILFIFYGTFNLNMKRHQFPTQTPGSVNFVLRTRLGKSRSREMEERDVIRHLWQLLNLCYSFLNREISFISFSFILLFQVFKENKTKFSFYSFFFFAHINPLEKWILKWVFFPFVLENKTKLSFYSFSALIKPVKFWKSNTF